MNQHTRRRAVSGAVFAVLITTLGGCSSDDGAGSDDGASSVTARDDGASSDTGNYTDGFGASASGSAEPSQECDAGSKLYAASLAGDMSAYEAAKADLDELDRDPGGGGSIIAADELAQMYVLERRCDLALFPGASVSAPVGGIESSPCVFAARTLSGWVALGSADEWDDSTRDYFFEWFDIDLPAKSDTSQREFYDALTRPPNNCSVAWFDRALQGLDPIG